MRTGIRDSCDRNLILTLDEGLIPMIGQLYRRVTGHPEDSHTANQ